MPNTEILMIPLLDNQLFMGLSVFYKYPFKEDKQVIVAIYNIINFNSISLEEKSYTIKYSMPS